MTDKKYTDFAERLTQLIENKNTSIKAVSDSTGINYEMVRRYANGKAKPREDKMKLLADFLETSIAYLDYGNESTQNDRIIANIKSSSNVIVDNGDIDDDEILANVYDVIFCCGDGDCEEYAFEEIKSVRKFPLSFFRDKGVKPENFKLVCAKNDSQHPYINDKDIVGIDISDTEIRDGEMYAILLDGERMFKQIFREGGGKFRLHCYNPAYPDKFIDHTNGKSLKIVGRQIYRAG